MKIKLTEEQLELLDLGTFVITPSGNEYRFLPFWFKKESDGTYSQMSFEKLPEDLKETVRKMRDGK